MAVVTLRDVKTLYIDFHHYCYFKDIMTDTSSKQKDADEVFSTGASSLDSGVLTNDQAIDLQERMSDLNRRWNVLNIDVIQREKRLDF